MEAVVGIDLSIVGSPSLVMRDLSEYSTLPFLAAFDVRPTSSSIAPGTPTKSVVPQKRITYIGLVKKTMPMLVDLFLRFKDSADIYVDGTLEAVISVSNFRNLIIRHWLTSCCKSIRHIQYRSSSNTIVLHHPNLEMTNLYGRQPLPVFCGSLRNAHSRSNLMVKVDRIYYHSLSHCSLDSQISQTLVLRAFGDRSLMYFVAVFLQIGSFHTMASFCEWCLHVIRGSSAADAFSLEVQESEENFDLALIGSLEIDVIPQLGDLRIPDSLVIQLAKVLRHGSRLHDSDVTSAGDKSTDNSRPTHQRSKESHDFETVDVREYGVGSTVSDPSVPRERFSYWCFDLLFLICSSTAKGNYETIYIPQFFSFFRCIKIKNLPAGV